MVIGGQIRDYTKAIGLLHLILKMCTVFSLIYMFSFLFRKVEVLNNKFFILCGQASLYIFLLHCYLTAGTRVFLSKIKCDNLYIYVIVGTFLGVAIPLLIYKYRVKYSIIRYLFNPIKEFRKRKE